MTITTVDGAIAGFKPPHFYHKGVTPLTVVGKPQSLWGLPGIPGAGAFDTTLNGIVLSSTAALVDGQIPHYDPGGGASSYLARFAGAFTNGGLMLLCDRLWHNGGYTITSNGVQSSVTPAWPARDDDGATAGKGVLLGLEISAGAGAAAPTITATYTNSGGTGGRTGGFGFATANSPVAGSFFPIRLQAGDVGVKSLESIQLSASWVSGTMNMVAYRVLASLEIGASYAGNAIDLLTGGMPQIFNGTVPFIMIIPAAATTGYATGHTIEVQG